MRKNIGYIVLFITICSFGSKPNKSGMNLLELKVAELLNDVRKDPKGFEEHIIAPMLKEAPTDEYLITLSSTLKEMKPAGELIGDAKLYQSAFCHAKGIGSKGLSTHERQSLSCKEKMTFNGECISFGKGKPSDILIQLLVDQGVPSYGHRKICLDSGYKRIGVSLEKHSVWGRCAVLDFSF